jgi:hypothetical protein
VLHLTALDLDRLPWQQFVPRPRASDKALAVGVTLTAPDSR